MNLSPQQRLIFHSEYLLTTSRPSLIAIIQPQEKNIRFKINYP